MKTTYTIRIFSFLIYLLFCFKIEAQKSFNINDVNGQTITIYGQESLTLYDSGGSNGNYKNNENYSVKICSKVSEIAGCPNQELNLFYDLIDIEGQVNCNFDFLEVSLSSGIEKYCNLKLPPLYNTTASFAHEEEDGCITVTFRANGTNVGKGFELSFIPDRINSSVGSLECNFNNAGNLTFPFHGNPLFTRSFFCNEDEIYICEEEIWDINESGKVTITIPEASGEDVDFFVGRVKNSFGIPGCQPKIIEKVACVLGNKNSIELDIIETGYFVVVDGKSPTDYQINVECEDIINKFDDCLKGEFDSSPVGNITSQSTIDQWQLWKSTSGDGLITSEKSYSSPNSLKISHTNTPTDVIYKLGDLVYNNNPIYPNNAHRYSWKMFIPQNNGGYFNFQHTESPGNWAFEVYFNSNGNGSITIENNSPISTFQYPRNSWFDVVTIIRLEDDEAELWIDKKFVHKWRFSRGRPIELKQIGSINFYGDPESSATYYIDDFCPKGSVCPGLTNCLEWPSGPVCVNGKQYVTGCDAFCDGYTLEEMIIGTCNGGESNACDNSTPIICGITISSTTIGETYKLYSPDYGNCLGGSNANEFQAPDKIFTFNHPGGDVGIHLWGKTLTVDLDVFLLDKCGKGWSGGGVHIVLDVPPNTQPNLNINCIASGVSTKEARNLDDDFIHVKNLAAGTYYIVVDGQYPTSVGDFDLSLTCGELNCTNATEIICNEPLNNQTNSTGQNNTSLYCSPAKQLPNNSEVLPSGSGCTGRERIYKYTAKQSGSVTVNVTGIDANEDFEVFVINNCNPDICVASGTKTYGQNETVIFQAVNGTTYQIVVDGYKGTQGNFNIGIICGANCQETTTKNNQIIAKYIGPEPTLKYTFTCSLSYDPSRSWKVNNTNVSGSSSGLTYTFPSSGSYTICYPYINSDGCPAYECIDVNIENPFNCNTITWKFTNGNYQFEIPSNFSNAAWTIDEDNLSIGTGNVSSLVAPISNCGFKTISVRYFDGTRWRICCLKIYLCGREDCFSNIIYNSTNNQGQFTLQESGATNITWFFDDAPTIGLGQVSSISVPYSESCTSRWISVKYRDANGRWRVCCRRVYFCNPFNCNTISVKYDPVFGRYIFDLNEVGAQNIKWTLDDTGQEVNGFLPASGPGQCKIRPVSVRYFKPELGWVICCMNFYHCNPRDCSNTITTQKISNNLSLSIPTNYTNINWFIGNNQIAIGNNAIVTLVAIGTNICVRYFDSSTKTWYLCCVTYDGGISIPKLVLDIDDKICGNINSVIKVPIRVKNFKNVISYQFSLKLQNSNHGSIMAIEQENYPGILSFNKNNDGSYVIIWDHTSEITLPDSSVLMYIQIKPSTILTEPSGISIIGTPSEINLSSIAGTIPHTVIDGSYCTSESGKLCGRITNEDNVVIPNVTVSLTGGGISQTKITDVNGQYCFENLPFGQVYMITPKKDVDYKNGVLASDVSKLRRHILGIEKLNSPYKIYASDVVNDEKTLASDIVDIRRLILNLIIDFPNRKSWEFIPKNFTIKDTSKPFEQSIPNSEEVNLTSENLQVDFIGMKMGDVDNSANGSLTRSQSDSRSAIELGLIVGNAIVGLNQEFEIPIKVKNFTELLSGQFSVNWDASKADFVNISHMNPLLQVSTLSNFNTAINGQIGFVWDATSPLTLKENDILFTIKLKSRNVLANGVAVNITDQPVEKNFQSANGVAVSINVTKGGFSVPTVDIDENKVRIFPNPTSSIINILTDIPLKTITIYDLTGKQLLTQSKENKMDITGLSSGIYIVKIETSKGISHHKLIVSE